MSKEQRARAAGGEAGGDSKEALERRMEEARESIAQTVIEIKDTVVDKYESVKESVEGARLARAVPQPPRRLGARRARGRGSRRGRRRPAHLAAPSPLACGLKR